MAYIERKPYEGFVIILRYTEKGGALLHIGIENRTDSFPTEASARKWIHQHKPREVADLHPPQIDPDDEQPRTGISV